MISQHGSFVRCPNLFNRVWWKCVTSHLITHVSSIKLARKSVQVNKSQGFFEKWLNCTLRNVCGNVLTLSRVFKTKSRLFRWIITGFCKSARRLRSKPLRSVNEKKDFSFRRRSLHFPRHSLHHVFTCRSNLSQKIWLSHQKKLFTKSPATTCHNTRFLAHYWMMWLGQNGVSSSQ